MKRSVFLANLRDSLNESGVGHYSYSDMAKFFLEFAEGQGMLPPFTEREITAVGNPKEIFDGWEPED